MGEPLETDAHLLLGYQSDALLCWDCIVGKRPTENRPAAEAIAPDRSRHRNRNPDILFLFHGSNGIHDRFIPHPYATLICPDLARGRGCSRAHPRAMVTSAHGGGSNVFDCGCSHLVLV